MMADEDIFEGEEDSLISTEIPVDQAVRIVAPKSNHLFTLEEDALEKLLLQDNIKDRYVVVVSVAGAFRKGKSFLLDFFLRYLKSKYGDPLHHDDKSWMGPQDVPLKGFPWRGGSERDTTGILMWSEIFLTDLPNGDKTAIILLDTQGTFDSESTVRDCATVFALSTMISSIQVYNMSQNIQEDDLQHLQLFTEYGRLALEDTGQKPFQKLQFLVRDWSYPYEAEYGDKGGRKMLDRRLQISNKQHPELQSIRKHIRSCFSEISCFLMPHPGLRVATKPNFDGRLSEIELDFQASIQKLVPMLLAPENLIIKEIGGIKVKAKELVQYFKSYINIYSGDELPEPKSMLVATAEANNLAAVAAAKELYYTLMENICGGGKPYYNSAQLESEHLCFKDNALDQFNNKRKMGGEEFSETYRAKLVADLNDMYEQFKLHNDSKNIFKAARTPAVFFTLSVGFYIISGVLGLIGMYSFANLCNLAMLFSIMTLSLWFYVRYSGELLEIGETIDGLADVLWETVLKPTYLIFVQKGIEQAVQNTTNSPEKFKTS